MPLARSFFSAEQDGKAAAGGITGDAAAIDAAADDGEIVRSGIVTLPPAISHCSHFSVFYRKRMRDYFAIARTNVKRNAR